jgi:hypothetical protein
MPSVVVGIENRLSDPEEERVLVQRSVINRHVHCFLSTNKVGTNKVDRL